MDQTTIDTYDQLAEEYDKETADFWAQFPRTFFDAFLVHLKGKEVLSVGSGPGRDSTILQTLGLRMSCLDASETMVRLSRGRGLHSILGDFTHMPFDAERFDGVWAYTSLLHVPKSEIAQSMREIRRVMKQGGTLALDMIEGEGEQYRESSGMEAPRWFSFYTKPEIEQLLKDHGFEIVHIEEFKPRSKNYLNYIARKIEVRE